MPYALPCGLRVVQAIRGGNTPTAVPTQLAIIVNIYLVPFDIHTWYGLSLLYSGTKDHYEMCLVRRLSLPERRAKLTNNS